VLGCQTAADALGLVRECPQPTLCWIFADVEGHIGWQASGRFPRRNPQYSGILPIPAWDPANHWQGWVPTDELPKLGASPLDWHKAASGAQPGVRSGRSR
jgi:penicillin amidase